MKEELKITTEDSPKNCVALGLLYTLVRFFVHPFVHIYDIVTPNDNRQGVSKVGGLSVLQRRDSGKFYRGSMWWKWCNNPRNACWLEYWFWTTFITWKLDKKGIEYDLIPLCDLEI